MLDMVALARSLAICPSVVGPLTEGHYVQLGLGLGFYVPESDFQVAQQRANETGKVQFLGISKDGRALHGTREEIKAMPDLAGQIAWIVPRV